MKPYGHDMGGRRMLTEAVVRKYGKAVALMQQGSTPGERKAARSAVERLEKKHASIRGAFLKHAAAEAAKAKAGQDFSPAREMVNDLPRDTVFQRFMRTAAEWTIDKLEDAINSSFDNLKENPAMGATKEAEGLDLDEYDDDYATLFHDHVSVEADVYEGEVESGGDLRELTVELPEELREWLQEEDSRLVAFAQYVLADDEA